MGLRDGIECHWVGAKHYFGRGHSGGVVVTGPMSQAHALKRVEEASRFGIKSAIAEETMTRAAWFNITVQLGLY